MTDPEELSNWVASELQGAEGADDSTRLEVLERLRARLEAEIEAASEPRQSAPGVDATRTA